MDTELRELSMTDGDEILEMIREIGPGENGFMNEEYRMSPVEFKEYLHRSIELSRGIGLKLNWVPQTKLWLYIDGCPVGIAKVRHYLNDNLKKVGGHIGYCIRPACRGRGFGNIILSRALEKAREYGIPRVLITCRETNIPSRKIIEHNGGKFERSENGELCFWIQLDEPLGFRELHIDDYDEIFSLWARTAGMGLNAADSRENISKFLLRNRGLSFCYKEKNEITGTILCGHDGRRGYIYHTAVDDKCRGRGIGNILVGKSLEKLKYNGIDKCHLFVFGDNEPGKAFWKKTGWTMREDILVYSQELN